MLLNRGTFRKPWHVIGVEPRAKLVATNTIPTGDPVLPDLIIVERARAKYGRNISMDALAALVKARGL